MPDGLDAYEVAAAAYALQRCRCLHRSEFYSSDPSLAELQVLVKDMGYEHLATTTRYGNTCCASCGNVDTARLVNGTGFYAVAAAQSMQTGGRGDGHYCTSSATSRNGTVGMGCLSCAKGRFLKAHPFLYPLWAQPEDPIFNEDWPGRPGRPGPVG
eukprot:g24237.t1